MGMLGKSRANANRVNEELFDPATGQAVDKEALLSGMDADRRAKFGGLATAIISNQKGYKWRPKQTPPTQTTVPPVATAEVTPQVPPVVSQPPNPATDIAQTILQQPVEPASTPIMSRRRRWNRPWWEDSV